MLNHRAARRLVSVIKPMNRIDFFDGIDWNGKDGECFCQLDKAWNMPREALPVTKLVMLFDFYMERPYE